MNEVTEDYWSCTSDQALALAHSSPTGLTTQEVMERQAKLSHGEFGHAKDSRWVLLAAQFSSPIVLLLATTAVLSFALDDATNGTIVLVILALSGVLGYWQECSAADAVARLLKVIDTLVAVRRDEQVIHVHRQDLVPGDIVLVKAGTVVPGDCRVVESNSILVDESALTGESFPVEKQTGPLEPATPVAQRSNCLFLGTHVASGSGAAVVMQVGRHTEFGKISDRLETRAASTDFERGLRRFGSLLVIVTSILVVGVFLANIENFGSMDTLCMDKTGTITSGTIELHQSMNLQGENDQEVLRWAWFNASSQTSFENPIDSAIQRAAEAQGVTQSECLRLAELPYDYQRKRLSVLVQTGAQRVLVTKGAYQNVIDICSHARVAGEIRPLADVRAELDERFQALSHSGYRVLAVATRAAQTTMLRKQDEQELTLVGLVTFADPLKADIHTALASLRELGIDLKLVSGDNAVVASTLASRAGFTNGRIVTGRQIRQWNADELALQVTHADIFAEVEPDQKEKIVHALRQSQRVVGFLGDGINDAPALHAADVGISVSSAVDVAKEAAQVVLMRSDLMVLSQGVREGRRTLDNTLKYIHFAISANFGYMLSMAIASLFLSFLPLLPGQILLINLLADFPAMALASDRVDSESIARPRRWEMKRLVHFMLTFGLAGTCADFLTFGTMLYVFKATPEQFRIGWFTVSVLTGLLIMLVIRTSRPFLRSLPGKWLVVAATIVAIITLAIPYTPVGPYFELAPPTPWMYVAIGLICVFYVSLLETLKQLLRWSAAAQHAVSTK